MPREALSVVITRAMTTIDEVIGPVTVIMLMHYQGAAQNEIKAVRPNTSHPIAPVEIAKMLQTAADNHAGGIPGNQQYEVLIFHEKTGDAAQTRYPFRVAGDQEQVGSLGTEAPTGQGLMMQLMRHNEALVRATIDMAGRMQTAMGQMIDRLATNNEKLQEENFDAIEIAKTVLFERVTNQHELAMKQRQFERATGERIELMKHLPAFVNMVTGREVFPQSTEDTALLEKFVGSMTAEQAEKFVGILSPEQSMMLMNRFAQIQDKLNREKSQVNGATIPRE